MYKTILIFCLCMPSLCGAQDHKFNFGLSAPLLFRQAQTYADAFTHMFGCIGLDGVVYVNGAEETDMSFMINTGITDDIRKYSPSVNTKIRNSLYFLNINPTVVIPSKWQHIQFCVGIGTLVRLGQDVVFSWSASSTGGGTSIDSMNNLLNDNARSIIPYVSFGVADDITNHLKLEFTIQPTLLNFYEPGTDMNFYYATVNSYGSKLLQLNYQPVYVGFRLFYFFKEVK